MTTKIKLANGKSLLPGKYTLRPLRIDNDGYEQVFIVETEQVEVDEVEKYCIKFKHGGHVRLISTIFENLLKGKSFAFTGTIDKRQEIKNALTINYHGEIRGAVTEKLHYLIVGSEPNKMKINRALSLGITMISAEFLYEWLNLKREEAIKNHCRNAFGNFNTTYFNEAFTKAANQISQDFERIAIRSSVLRKAESIANVEGVAFVKVTPESCEVIKSSDIVMMVRRDSEPEASQAANPVGLHQSTGERPATAELNRFSNDAHTTPTIDEIYEKLISNFLDSEDMQTILRQMAFLDVPHKNILTEFEKQLKEASSKIGKDGVFVQALGRGIRTEPEYMSYLFELKNDGSVLVKDCGKEYHFPIWLSQMTIAYCGKSELGANHRFYQRYDLASKEIGNCSRSDSEYQNKINDFIRLIDFVHRSL